MINSLHSAIEKHGLLKPGQTVIVAVSGGADSLALLFGLHILGYAVVAAHCNFHLRGAESDRDEAHVRAVCASLDVPLEVRHFDVDARRAETGESVEMACRELRYAWFDELVKKHSKAGGDSPRIAVGHHREDNVETFFLNLMRGSSIHGLTGMRYRNGNIIRPLLDVSRADTENFLTDNDIEFVDDSTNAENEFARNRLRNIILPQIEEAFPGACDGIRRSIALLARNCAFYDSAIAMRKARYISGKVIDIDAIKASDDDPQLVIYEMLKDYGFNATQTSKMLSAVTGARFSSPSHSIEISRGNGVIRKFKDKESVEVIKVEEVEIDLSHNGQVLLPDGKKLAINILPISNFKPTRDPSTAYFDIIIIDEGPFVLRHWQRGDRMTIFGMKGTRLVSDVFSDAKLNGDEKKSAWLLTTANDVLWAAGLKNSALYPVGEKSPYFVKVTID